MALQLAKTTEEGFSVEYWRVDPVTSVNMHTRTATARVLCYKDAAARQGGKIPVRVGPSLEAPDSVTIEGTDFDTALATGDTRGAMYGVLKALPFFSGAVDV